LGIILIIAIFLTLTSQASALTTTFTYKQGEKADYLKVYFYGEVGSGNVASWEWDFDSDGITDNASQNPVYTFPVVDTYTVKLTTTFDTGVTESRTLNVIMKEPELEASFSTSVSSGDAPLQVNFTDLTLGVHDTRWDFRDKTPKIALKNPTHNFTESGTYWVLLTVTGINGNTDDYTKEIVVNNPAPASFFTADQRSGRPPLSVQFADRSTIVYGKITGWYWTFGDGTSSEEQNPVHEYSQPGNFTVALKVTSDYSRTNTSARTDYITVTNGITASIKAEETNGFVPFIVKFTSKIPANIKIKSYHWDFEDGTSAVANPVHTFRKPGVYNVSLTVTDTDGESFTVTKNNYIIVEREANGNENEINTIENTNDSTGKNAELNILTDSGNITGILDNPGTEFIKKESLRFQNLFGEWLRLITEILGLNKK
jgi:PKD repeat protein